MIKIFLSFVFLIFATNSNADQNSPQLDKLFEDLYKVQDLTQQNKIVSNIWSEWMKIDNPEYQKIMDMIPYFFRQEIMMKRLTLYLMSLNKNLVFQKLITKELHFIL